MATRSAPATPTTGAQIVASNDPTGTWRHPKLDEIHRRLNATTFSEQNVKQIVWRLPIIAVVMSSSKINRILHRYLGMDIAKQLSPNLTAWLYFMCVVVVITYALWPLRPLFLQTDDLSDIPLTPSQRALLGLTPSSQPVTPGEKYITPPRYARSSTPRSSSGSLSGSPLSGKGSPGSGGLAGALYSASPSPLFQKAVGRDTNRRLSYGSHSPLSMGKPLNESSSSLVPNTPSPSSGRGASVGLSSKWLYERGRSASGLRSVYS